MPSSARSGITTRLSSAKIRSGAVRSSTTEPARAAIALSGIDGEGQLVREPGNAEPPQWILDERLRDSIRSRPGCRSPIPPNG